MNALSSHIGSARRADKTTVPALDPTSICSQVALTHGAMRAMAGAILTAARVDRRSIGGWSRRSATAFPHIYRMCAMASDAAHRADQITARQVQIAVATSLLAGSDRRDGGIHREFRIVSWAQLGDPTDVVLSEEEAAVGGRDDRPWGRSPRSGCWCSTSPPPGRRTVTIFRVSG
jgi:hypothetical protein